MLGVFNEMIGVKGLLADENVTGKVLSIGGKTFVLALNVVVSVVVHAALVLVRRLIDSHII